MLLGARNVAVAAGAGAARGGTFRTAARAAATSSSGGDGAAMQAPKHINRLATEQSPYLRQHAHNPVRRRHVVAAIADG